MNKQDVEKLLQPKPSTIAQLRRTRPQAQWAKPDPEHGTLSWKVGQYTCPELKTNAGLPEGRMAAYKLPSRVGNKLYYPDGRVEPVA